MAGLPRRCWRRRRRCWRRRSRRLSRRRVAPREVIAARRATAAAGQEGAAASGGNGGGASGASPSGRGSSGSSAKRTPGSLVRPPSQRGPAKERRGRRGRAVHHRWAALSTRRSARILTRAEARPSPHGRASAVLRKLDLEILARPPYASPRGLRPRRSARPSVAGGERIVPPTPADEEPVNMW